VRSEHDFEEASKQVLNALHAHFKPEFLNRVDDIIVFHPLGKEQLVKIIELRLEDVRRLLADRKISLELTDAAKDLLFTQGYDPNFRSPSLKRAIQKLVQDPLALEDSRRSNPEWRPHNRRRRQKSRQNDLRSKPPQSRKIEPSKSKALTSSRTTWGQPPRPVQSSETRSLAAPYPR